MSLGRAGSKLALALVALLASPALPAGASASGPEPGSLEYIQRDTQNMADAYGRQTAPDGQLSAAYLAALPAGTNSGYLQQLADQLANPTRPVLTPGQLVPGWNQGNPYRYGWAGRRGLEVPIAFTNRYGALLRGDVYAPLPGARDPYTGRALEPPYPAVVVTTGSIQGSEKMYRWLAHDLAERGYVVLTYDVQGQGTSETLPHQGSLEDIPACDPIADPQPGEMTGCPGVPFQQSANFIYGTEDAIDFMLATSESPYPNPARGSASVNDFNPLWELVDRRRDRGTLTKGRTTRVAVVGHSLGAAAVSFVQGIDRRVQAVVALDKLSGSGSFIQDQEVTPAVPALGVQSEYGFNVAPYWMMGGSSVSPQPGSPAEAPDPRRELRTGFDPWREAGVDSMVIVPRASTHLEYTDINFALPASRWGQALTSHYVQAWLDKYLKRDPSADSRLLATDLAYLEPKGAGVWAEERLDRADHLSFYFCSAYAFRAGKQRKLIEDTDIAGVGC